MIVVGDRKTPDVYSARPCEYLSINRQRSLSELASFLPVDHYARKNIGYLYALKSGFERIVETDDDNIPRDNFLSRHSPVVMAQSLASPGWSNVYRYFSNSPIWPRGYPLEYLTSHGRLEPLPAREVYAPIQQGLADDNPDVDSVYRMTGALPVTFEKRDDIALGKGVWCPFNSQNTTWFKDAFPLLYLPSYCSFRMTDIWRSFVAQRILWECDASLLFHNATVWQERNAHDLLKDFRDEIPGYLNNDRIKSALEGVSLLSGWGNAGENLVRCYTALIQLGVIESRELPLVRSWLKEVENA